MGRPLTHEHQHVTLAAISESSAHLASANRRLECEHTVHGHWSQELTAVLNSLTFARR
jgi:hypothetical protein